MRRIQEILFESDKRSLCAAQVPETAFIFTVETSTAHETFIFPSRQQDTNCTVDWGDGTIDTITTWNSSKWTHVYSTIGDRDIKIVGTCGAPKFRGSSSRTKITNIKNWGRLIGATDWSSAFFSCSNLTATANDPFGQNVIDMSFMFTSAYQFNGDISNWDTISVNNMNYMFYSALGFDQNLTAWHVPLIPSEPLLFSANCPLQEQNKPHWGQ